MHIRYITEIMQQQLRIATSYHSTDNRGLRGLIGRMDSFLLVLRSAPDEEQKGPECLGQLNLFRSMNVARTRLTIQICMSEKSYRDTLNGVKVQMANKQDKRL